MADPIRVLFLCTQNSARSQMAEGLLRDIGGDRFEVMGAGTEQTDGRPQAIKAMAELGVHISHHSSKTPDRFVYERFELVITGCDDANESCPVFPNAERRWHWSIHDQSRATGAKEERMTAFREARDQSKRRIEGDLLREVAWARRGRRQNLE